MFVRKGNDPGRREGSRLLTQSPGTRLPSIEIRFYNQTDKLTLPLIKKKSGPHRAQKKR